MSADDCGIHNASCENRTPWVIPNQVWHQLIFSEAVSTGHSIYNACNACVIERRLSNFCLHYKTAAARRKRDNDD